RAPVAALEPDDAHDAAAGAARSVGAAPRPDPQRGASSNRRGASGRTIAGMAEDTIGAEDVARKQFSTGFRGFDQYEVRAFLAQVASTLATLHEREKSLRERLAAVEEHPPTRALDPNDLEAALGTEMAKVLQAAREAAAEIRERAEES